jgi:hypothetical protein
MNSVSTPPHHQLLAAAQLDEPEQVLVGGREVPSEGVLGLVEVVVGVEHRKVERAGHEPHYM